MPSPSAPESQLQSRRRVTTQSASDNKDREPESEGDFGCVNVNDTKQEKLFELELNLIRAKIRFCYSLCALGIVAMVYLASITFGRGC